ncbi:hypothetical protein DEO72_LG3g961 [Vigna unguiculata]|uniref:Uncharacterized protein n=1 Tax=Vigna unguiculata TaxID=3917 RepID=A0A4D6LD41_VIGUN|nr:hypothetical protein DEO72_LG3g961 [Vigna unguiculata]
MTMYLEPFPRAFLYFFVSRPKSLITWLSLISQPGLNRLDAFTHSFKHLKDGFFKVVVKPAGRSHFHTADGHMAQLGKKNLTLFQTLRKEKAVKARAARNTKVPNLQDSLVDVHVHSGTKRKAELPTRPGKGKDVKKVRSVVMGVGSASEVKGPKAWLIELPETTVRKDIEINVPESLMDSIDNMEPKALVKAMDKVDKHAKEKEAWKKEKEEWEAERKRLATWKVRCLDSEEKLKGRIADLDADYDESRKNMMGWRVN